ncbi:MAG TPA: GNAT family acetyltransferase [Tepidisphaeraceae bacterium]|jgi:ribosomal protein S18 acetylase RimI-like enzyme
MVQIVIYAETYEQAVIDLWREAFGYSAPHNDPAFVIRQKLEVQPDLFLVAIEGNDVVGTVMGGYDGHRGWVYSLAVAPGHRGRGIGTLLVREIEKGLRGYGCAKVNLQILAGNRAVAAFYKNLGYAVEERIQMGKLL